MSNRQPLPQLEETVITIPTDAFASAMLWPLVVILIALAL